MSRLPEIGPGRVILERSGTPIDRSPAGPGSRWSQAPAGIANVSARARTGEDPIGDVVDRGVIAEPPAHALIEIDGQDVASERPGPAHRRRCPRRDRRPADRRIAWLCAGRPAPTVACSTPVGSTHIRWPRSNLSGRLAAGLDQADRGGDRCGRGPLPEPCQVRRAGSTGPSRLRSSSRLPASVVRTHASASTASSPSGRSSSLRGSILDSSRMRDQRLRMSAVASSSYRPGVEPCSNIVIAFAARRSPHCARAAAAWARCRFPRGSSWRRWPATRAWRSGWRCANAADSAWRRPTWSTPDR